MASSEKKLNRNVRSLEEFMVDGYKVQSKYRTGRFYVVIEFTGLHIEANGVGSTFPIALDRAIRDIRKVAAEHDRRWEEDRRWCTE